MTEVKITPALGTIPDNLTVGQNATVNCNADLNTNIDPDMSSLHKERYLNEMITDHQTFLRSNFLQLRLSKVRTSFAGHYKCVAWINNNTLTNESNSILLCVTCELVVNAFKLARHNYSQIFIVMLCYFIPLLLFILQLQNLIKIIIMST